MDVTLHYTEQGSGEPLVLLHGNGEDGSHFAHQVPMLARAFHVIALDTRGHGGSSRGEAPFTLAQFACDLGDFLDEQGIGAAHVLGFSDGANIALLFALAHRERVLSLVLNGANLYPGGLAEGVRRDIAAGYEKALAAGDAREAELLRLMIDEPRIDPADLAGLGMTALVIAGTDDMIEERHTRLIAESIPAAELRFVEGSHFVATENPDAFNRVLAEFYGMRLEDVPS